MAFFTEKQWAYQNKSPVPNHKQFEHLLTGFSTLYHWISWNKIQKINNSTLVLTQEEKKLQRYNVCPNVSWWAVVNPVQDAIMKDV